MKSITNALNVIARTDHIAEYLQANDPKALEQVREALRTTPDLNFDDISALRKLVESDISAMHNHIASAVESPHHWQGAQSAPELVKRLREKEELYKKLNGSILRAQGVL